MGQKKKFFDPPSENLTKKTDFTGKCFWRRREKTALTFVDPVNWTIRLIGFWIIGALLLKQGQFQNN